MRACSFHLSLAASMLDTANASRAIWLLPFRQVRNTQGRPKNAPCFAQRQFVGRCRTYTTVPYASSD